MAVRQLEPDDWQLFRGLRLEALTADPDAFGSSYEREVAFAEATWRQRLTDVDGRPLAVLVDELDGLEEPAGLAGIGYFESADTPMLVSMWVRPPARGRGSGRRLVDAAIAWARGRSASEVFLWVVRENEGAIGLYESCGFVATGAVDALPSNPCVNELEMRLRL